MATHDYVIDNQSAPSLRSDLNNALQAIVTQNSSATAPTTTYADMIWYDTANNQLKKRNEANSGWVTLGTVNEGAGTFTPSGVTDTFTLLGTVTTTSGTTQTLSGLDLTDYTQVEVWLNGVSSTVASFQTPTYFSIGGVNFFYLTSAGDGISGLASIDLATGVGSGLLDRGGVTTITNASTSISITTSAGTFDAGSVRIYGVK